MALKKWVKVTDLPKKVEMEDEDDEESLAMLKISISPKGQKEIEEEAEDVKNTWMKIKDTKVVRNVENSFKRWDHSKEMDAVRALDKKFLASKEGKRLMAEWKDFGETLKKHVKKTKNGIKVDNKAIDEISDEADDVAQQYKDLKGSKWDHAYHDAWKAAFENK